MGRNPAQPGVDIQRLKNLGFSDWFIDLILKGGSGGGSGQLYLSEDDFEGDGLAALTEISIKKQYKGYVAQLAQTGTATPAIKLLQNTYDDVITVSRDSAGYYLLTSSGDEFDIDTLHINGFGFNNAGRSPMMPVFNSAGSLAGYYYFEWESDSRIALYTISSSFAQVEMSTLFGAAGALCLPEIRNYI
jgi:hypothetical protein